MELDDEIMVVIVGDESENEDGPFNFPVRIKEEVLDEVDGTLTGQESASVVKEEVVIKEEVLDENIEDETVEYLHDNEEIFADFIPEDSDLYNVCDDDDEDYVPKDDDASDDEFIPDVKENFEIRRKKLRHLKPWQWKSFVKELREQYTELEQDQDLLVASLVEIMKTIKPPPLPRDYYVMNGIMFQCIDCTTVSDSIPAAGRHYQEKHGPRYLICFACGVDFRSTTNLYKHEKRCAAPDSEIVLRARAITVGNKGRARPFLLPKAIKEIKCDKSENGDVKTKQRFVCDLCPGSFYNKQALVSHIHVHNGVRPYKCPSCPCAYTSQSALSRHSKKHGDVRYVCEHCSRPFQVKAALVSHLDTHLPKRKHKCEECGRRFAQKSALLLHVNGKHRNLPPPCACQICPKRFRRMTLLKAHMKKAHGMLLMTRKMFFKNLPTMTDTQIQQAKVILKSEEPVYSVKKQEPPDPNEEFLTYLERLGATPCVEQDSESERTNKLEDF